MEKEKNREQKALDQIAKVAAKLDKDLEEIKRKKKEEPERSHDLIIWLKEKKALHQIKKILHDVSHYENFDEESFAAEEAYMNAYWMERSDWNQLM
ncbi:hypothetical protein ACYSNO_05915 [Enterococcus sp. LJL98]